MSGCYYEGQEAEGFDVQALLDLEQGYQDLQDAAKLEGGDFSWMDWATYLELCD